MNLCLGSLLIFCPPLAYPHLVLHESTTDFWCDGFSAITFSCTLCDCLWLGCTMHHVLHSGFKYLWIALKGNAKHKMITCLLQMLWGNVLNGRECFWSCKDWEEQKNKGDKISKLWRNKALVLSILFSKKVESKGRRQSRMPNCITYASFEICEGWTPFILKCVKDIKEDVDVIVSALSGINFKRWPIDFFFHKDKIISFVHSLHWINRFTRDMRSNKGRWQCLPLLQKIKPIGLLILHASMWKQINA